MAEFKRRYRTTPKFRNFVVWVATVVISLIFIFAGNKIVTKDLNILHADDAYAEKAKITSIEKTESSSYSLSDEIEYQDDRIYFKARILTGEFKGQEVLGAQTSDNYTLDPDQPLSVGDKVILYNYGTKEGEADWVFGGFYRLDGMIRFGLLFCAALLFFGHLKGLNTLISLAFTCMAVFMVFVPSVLAGYNVYVMTCLTCVYVIIMTLLITTGATEKAFTTILGCSFGVAVAAILELFLESALRLTGIIDEHSIYLGYLDSGVVIDLKSLIFGMIVIGAMGAVMDVAMDISSALHELHYRAPDLKFGELYQSGITIGRDVMGTMANTLVLAYIGSSLCTILLLLTYSSSLRELLKRENNSVELMQALI
ncbi:MAG: YibE/F family protein, partial [Firmicutes bacterium]|nr:YibE/F family protein [Bacillota bacterium]